MANRGYWFQRQVGKYLCDRFGSSNVKSEVPMNGKQADFFVRGNQVWEAKSQSPIDKACVDQVADTARGNGKAVLAVGNGARVSPTVREYAAAKKVEIIEMPF